MPRAGSPVVVTVDLHAMLPARSESIAALRHAVVDFAVGRGASECQRDDIAVAVSEALSNAVQHAYVSREAPGTVAVHAWMHERSLQVLVRDEGHGMLPRLDSPGMGLGLALIGKLTEQVELDSLDAAGVRVRMTFAIG